MIPLLGIYPKKPKALPWKNISTPVFIAIFFTITRMWKQPKCPSVQEWVILWDLHTMEYYLAIKKKKILPFATARRDPENIVLRPIGQSEKDNYCMCSIIRTN